MVRTVIAFGLVAILFLIAVSVQALIATMKLKSVQAKFEKDSIPLSWPELYQHFPNAEAHLAAQANFFVALDALKNLHDMTDKKKDVLSDKGYIALSKISSNVPPDVISALDNLLRDLSPALEAVRDAVANEPFWLVPPKNKFDFPISQYSTVRQAVRLFNMSAILHSERNEPRAATQAVIDGIHLAEVLHRGSLMVDELVRFACERIALHSLEYVLAKTNPPEDSLRKVESLLSEHSDMRTGIMGEIIYTKQIYEDMSDFSRTDMETMIELSDSEPWQNVISYLTIMPGWIRMNEAYHLELLYCVVNIWNLPLQDFTKEYEQASDSIPWPYFLPTMSENVYVNLKKQELRTAGAWRCARIAVAIELYSEEHGGLPRTLTDLVPGYLEELPTEPFYGRPFVYTRNDNTGTLTFSYPDSDEDFTFKVFASKGGIE